MFLIVNHDLMCMQTQFRLNCLNEINNVKLVKVAEVMNTLIKQMTGGIAY